MKSLLIAFLFLISYSVAANAQTRSIGAGSVVIDDGAGNFLNLIVASLAAHHTVTFPDPGADASVILSTSTGGQTIIGGLSVSGGITSGSFSLPTSTGLNGDVLTSDGAGGSSWHSGSSGLSAYGYIYSAYASNQSLPIGANIVFSNNGPLTNVSHTAGTSTLTVSNAGTYEISFVVNYGDGGDFAIAVNGTVNSSTNIPAYLNNAEASGTSILTLAAGDVLTLHNNSPTGQSPQPSYTVASIAITKLN